MKSLVMLIFFLAAIVLICWIVKTVYYSFLKRKDEREHYILVNAMAQAFCILTLL